MQDFKRRLKNFSCTITTGNPDESCFTTWPNSVEQNNAMLWTSVLTCQLTGEKFPSGKLRGKEGSYAVDYMLYDPESNFLVSHCSDSENDELVRIDLVWYKTKSEAENAAAARAVDCLRFRYPSGHPSDNVRYCEEEPYLAEYTSKSWNAACSADLVIIIDEEKGQARRYPGFACMESEFTDELICGILKDDEGDAYLEAYKQSRMVPQNNLERISVESMSN